VRIRSLDCSQGTQAPSPGRRGQTRFALPFPTVVSARAPSEVVVDGRVLDPVEVDAPDTVGVL